MASVAQSLGSIRRAESGATRSLREFEKAVRGIKRVMVRAVQVEGKRVHKRNARRYARSQYANRRGGLKRIKSYGVKWGKRKAQLGLDKRRGVARKGILKTVKSPKSFRKTDNGFVIDYERPDITVTGRATLGKSKRSIAGKRIIEGKGAARQVIGIGVKFQNTNRRSFRVNNYIGHFADQKAPGLGSITRKDEKAIDKEAVEAVDKHVRSVKGASRALTKQARTKITLKLGRLVT